MKFSEALQAAIDTGIGIYRPSWKGNAHREPGEPLPQFVERRPQIGEEKPPHPITAPFFVIHQPNGCATWIPSVGDLFAEDWETL